MSTPAEDKPIETFERFWTFYLAQHSRAGTKILHFIGTSVAMVCIATAVLRPSPMLAPLGIAFGYALAWTGHWIIEKNRPATFRYPLWSFIADLKLWAHVLTGRMAAEVERPLHPETPRRG